MVMPRSLPGWFIHYQERYPCDILSLCDQIGVECHKQNLRDSVAGYISRVDKGTHQGYRIVYNDNHPRMRQRFTVAHLLGHYYLHWDALGAGTDDNTSYRSCNDFHENPNITGIHEREANAFAADLLMPNLLIAQWDCDGSSFEEVRKRLDVSESALRFRLKKLNIKLE